MKINLFYKTDKKIIHPKKIKKIIKKIVKVLFSNAKNTELNFLFVNNKKIKEFNKRFLNKNTSTDVLCFKYDKNSADIVISIQEVFKNAKRFKTTYKKEFIFVIIHAILHFKGMNDDTEEKRGKMFDVAEKILSKLEVEGFLC
jgi:probable rRNA maturation factor